MIPAEAVEAALVAFANAPYDPPPTTEAQMKRANRERMMLALEAAAPHLLNQSAHKPKHQCEPWQIQVNQSGTFRYCAACGEPQK